LIFLDGVARSGCLARGLGCEGSVDGGWNHTGLNGTELFSTVLSGPLTNGLLIVSGSISWVGRFGDGFAVSTTDTVQTFALAFSAPNMSFGLVVFVSATDGRTGARASLVLLVGAAIPFEPTGDTPDNVRRSSAAGSVSLGLLVLASGLES
jgi:hypothetical protein